MIDVKAYREQIRFDDPDTPSPAQRAKYLLFFVTRVARLRNDMTPAVISDRLHDWGYDDITADEINAAFDKDPDVRPSRMRRGAYEITPVAEMRIRKQLKSLELQTRQSMLIRFAFTVMMMSFIVLLALVAYNSTTSRITVRDLSLPEFRRRIGFDEANTSPADRTKYFLYFITQVVELRDDMTPEVIEERLNDIGYRDITATEIREAFLLDPDVEGSSQRQGAFKINPLAYEKFEVMLDLEVLSVEVLTLEWLWQHVPIQGWLSLLTGFVALISGSFVLGYRFALHRPKEE